MSQPLRRDLLRGAGALGLAGLAAPGALAASSGLIAPAPKVVPVRRPSAPVMIPGPAGPVPFEPAMPIPPDLEGACTLTASGVEGPFWFDSGLVQKTINDGKPGLLFALFLQVVDADTCDPIHGAVCDVWHTDGLGSYSGYASQGTAGETFCRGIQVTNSNGVASFLTIYPGWYPSRTPHLHLKVNPDETSELTTQLYSIDPLSDLIYTLLGPYDTKGPSAVNNGTDGLFTPSTVMNFGILPGAVGLYGWLVIAIDRS